MKFLVHSLPIYVKTWFYLSSLCKVIELKTYFLYKLLLPTLAYLIFDVLFCSLGEITLHDFKMLLDRSGSYRYFFKSMDPDFGSVREEVSLIFFIHILNLIQFSFVNIFYATFFEIFNFSWYDELITACFSFFN